MIEKRSAPGYFQLTTERHALAKAVHVGLRAGTTAVMLTMSSMVLSQSNFSAVVELSDLDGSDGFVINGSDANGHVGRSVAGIGDVNGDGLDDLLIGAFREDTDSNIGAGRSYVVFGSAETGSTGQIQLTELDGTNGYVINGIDNFDRSGRSVSFGDINGDGSVDLIIGASRAGPGIPGNSRRGETYVVFGGDVVGSDGQIELSELDGSDGFVINGIDTRDYSGRTVSGVDDFNGDGVDDLIIAANFADPNGDFSGESYVVFGGSVVGSDGSFELSDLDGSDGFVINGIDERDFAGRSVSGAGDINGDGVADLIIGADGAGESYVVFGGGSVGEAFELSDLDGADGFVISGVDVNDRSGFSVSGAGDINSDGVADLIIGAGYADPNGDIDAGESYVLFGGGGVGSAGMIALAELDGSDGFVINGIDADDRSGYSVSGAGDINGDGVADLIIGAFGAGPNGDYSGESYVVFGGSAVGSDGSFELSDLDGSDGFVINGIDASDSSGRAVSGAGDVNGDGVDDLIIGALNASPNSAFRAGESYVVFGKNVPQCNGLFITVDLNAGETPTGGDDVILGTPEADTIKALAGDDTICGEGGDDIINGGNGDDWIDGGAGNDQIRGNNGMDEIFGDVGDDEIRGGADDDTIEGEDGDDTLSGQGGNDTIDGGNGVDDISGGGGQDTLYAGSGATVGTGKLVFGGSGSDTLIGGPDADDLRGSNGNDIINGFGGNDFISGGLGRDIADGGDGDDEIRGNGAVDTLSGGAGNDLIEGGSQSDIINGNDGDDTLLGGSGRDEINGGAGSDELIGGADDDTLDGGESSGDVCSGNLGTDTATGDCEVIN